MAADNSATEAVGGSGDLTCPAPLILQGLLILRPSESPLRKIMLANTQPHH